MNVATFSESLNDKLFWLPDLCSNDCPSKQADLEALAASLQSVMGEDDEDKDEGVEKDSGETQDSGEVSITEKKMPCQACCM